MTISSGPARPRQSPRILTNQPLLRYRALPRRNGNQRPRGNDGARPAGKEARHPVISVLALSAWTRYAAVCAFATESPHPSQDAAAVARGSTLPIARQTRAAVPIATLSHRLEASRSGQKHLLGMMAEMRLAMLDEPRGQGVIDAGASFGQAMPRNLVRRAIGKSAEEVYEPPGNFPPLPYFRHTPHRRPPPLSLPPHASHVQTTRCESVQSHAAHDGGTDCDAVSGDKPEQPTLGRTPPAYGVVQIVAGRSAHSYPLRSDVRDPSFPRTGTHFYYDV
ncbi:hypothetical protein BDK51DRAFT_41783 [Blyttiomyces helicus]|uniref:Uncharacterized protein n=1 Tax=Blyttiomyces helicus TaxID=388810 RepID=A0A4P9VXI5_9FUNG|nr:hypothetical protein BDK51DRAFT_41783 [Blyttiomyces helicus]|eukprot:RKO82988.1 hypothetical protein BDK51DRAFT_41783 [Blyttiomyces helicus]